jgi:hypothetical protein
MLKAVPVATPIEEDVFSSTTYERRGILRTKVKVDLVDVWGNLVTRTCSAGTILSATMERAEAAAKSVRASNPDLKITVNWSVDL